MSESDRAEALKLYSRIGVLSGQMEMLRERVGALEDLMERSNQKIMDRLDRLSRSLEDIEDKTDSNKSNIKFLLMNAAVGVASGGSIAGMLMQYGG
jgi:uncharacterized protein Yka (UPF0111/DUF47 family)